MVEMLGFLSELCSFLVIGMISYNVRPFDVHWSWILLITFVVFISRYAAMTGIMATLLKWLEPSNRLLDQSQSILLFLIYRGSVSFSLTARAEGELLENEQVVLMMRLSLCLIWVSLIQHIFISYPKAPLLRYEGLLASDSSENNSDDTKPDSFLTVFNNWIYSILVKESCEEEEMLLNDSEDNLKELEI